MNDNAPVALYDDALADCDCWGITADQARYMLAHAAPITHDLGNWRYEDFLFDVDDDGSIMSITRLKEDGSAEFCELPEDDTVYDHTCLYCNADGGPCMVCHGSGTVRMTNKEYEQAKEGHLRV